MTKIFMSLCSFLNLRVLRILTLSSSSRFPHPRVPWREAAADDGKDGRPCGSLRKNLFAFYTNCACTAVSATTPTMSCQEQPRDRSLTGFAIPWSIGP